jgi:hypothetical protein
MNAPYTFLVIKSLKKAILLLYFLSDKIAFQAPGADLKGDGGAVDQGLYLLQIRLPGTAEMILGMAHRITGDGVFSADIAGP